MASNKFFQNAVVAAATLSVAVLAGCPGTPTTPTPSGSASAKPSAPASTTPSGTPTAPASGSSASATPSAAPTSIPSTPDTSSRATIQGIVVDDSNQRLSDVTVTGKVLGAGTFANGSDSLSVNTQIGSYSLNGAPTGQTILVSVTKNGYTTRQKTIVPLANLQGNTDLNRVDFGFNPADTSKVEPIFCMSTKPEITSMTPTPDATGVDAATTFTMTFNKPMNTSDVENYFAVAVASAATNSQYQLSSQNVTVGKKDKMFNSTTDAFESTNDATFAGAATITTAIFDTSHFNYAWSNNNQTMTATFRPGFKLPTDKDASKLPQYAVGFKQSVRAADSFARSNQFFRVSPAQLGKNGYKFTVAADTTAPRLVSISALDNNQNYGGYDGIRYQFSETMVLYPNTAALTLGARIPDANQTGDALTANGAKFYARQNPLVAAAVSTQVPSGVTQLWQFNSDNGDITAGADDAAHTALRTALGKWGTDTVDAMAAGTGGAAFVQLDAAKGPSAGKGSFSLKGTVKQAGLTGNGDTGNAGATSVAPVASLYDGDTTQSTISINTGTIFMINGTGKKIWGGVDNTVQDPAGNAIDTSNNNNIKSANSI